MRRRAPCYPSLTPRHETSPPLNFFFFSCCAWSAWSAQRHGLYSPVTPCPATLSSHSTLNIYRVPAALTYAFPCAHRIPHIHLPTTITTTHYHYHHYPPSYQPLWHRQQTNERETTVRARTHVHGHVHARSLARFTRRTLAHHAHRARRPPTAFCLGTQSCDTIDGFPGISSPPFLPRLAILASPCLASLACPALLARLVCRFLFLLVSRLHLLVAPVLARPPCTQSTRAVWPNNNFFVFRFSEPRALSLF